MVYICSKTVQEENMIPCYDCGVYFFTPESREQHDVYCIGYNPATKNEGEKQKALKTARHGLRPIGVRK
jgi:hypothetical protein